MRPLNLDKLIEICEAATPGGWRKCGGMTPHYMAIDSIDGYVVFAMADGQYDTEHGEPIRTPSASAQDANARFIVTAREALPELAKRMKRLQVLLGDVWGITKATRDELGFLPSFSEEELAELRELLGLGLGPGSE